MKKWFCFIVVTGMLGACGDGSVRENLGLVNQPPDEFKVVSRAPLTVPKEFFLYPPEEAASRASFMASDTIAKEALLGGVDGSQASYLEHYQEEGVPSATPETAVEAVGTSALASPAEEGLLQKLKVTQADPNIRSLLKEEVAEEKLEDESLLSKIRHPVKESEPLVDAEKERERLLKNKKKGKAVTAGEVPTVTEKSSVLDRLF